MIKLISYKHLKYNICKYIVIVLHNISRNQVKHKIVAFYIKEILYIIEYFFWTPRFIFLQARFLANSYALFHPLDPEQLFYECSNQVIH